MAAKICVEAIGTASKGPRANGGGGQLKRALSLLLVLVLALCGCGKESAETRQSAYNIVRVMLASQGENAEADTLVWYREPEELSAYLAEVCRAAGVSLLDGAAVRAEGARAFELAALLVDGDVSAAAEDVREYLTGRRAAFTGYFPEQASLVDKGLVLTRGQWVALVVCERPEDARTYFDTCFGDGVNARGIPAVLGPAPEDYRADGRLIYIDPLLDDMTLFDSSAILAAWESGDASGLSANEKRVLDAAAEVLEERTDPDMSAYEKERAIYAWLVTHVDYDRSHYEKRGAPRTSYEPYGPLINGKGVCLGYAETFRLLMDMAGVECVTVTGAAFRNRENHAWNMVHLNGDWYCVDPTWDHIDVDMDYPADELLPLCEYFNVTSQYMADTDHQWDYDNIPEATAEDGGQPEN